MRRDLTGAGSIVPTLMPTLSRALILLLFIAAPALAAGPSFPRLSGRVVDDAGVLNAATQSQLTAMLADYERASRQQVVVVTLKSLQGYPIEDFSYQIGRNWGIGQKDKNTGALLIIAPVEHKVRIEVGYGLEGVLTDAASRTIIERDILPAFRGGDFDAGVLAGTASIVRVLSGKEPATAEPEVRPAVHAQGSPLLYLGLMGFWFIFIAMRNSLVQRRGVGGMRPRGVYLGGGFGGGLGGGGFGGGGGFSGGGGSFGGGGASGSW